MIEENCVLFVDDEEDVLSSLKRQFRKSDFKLYTAVGGSAALDLLKTKPVRIVITDERMPGMTGLELLQKVKKMYPDTIRIILSGYADSDSIINSINMGEVYRFVSKPWNRETLMEVILQAFSQYNVIQQNREYMHQIIEENQQLHRNLSLRENDLEITWEILNMLPIPVLVVAHDNTIELFNIAAGSLSELQFVTGVSLDSIFPTGIAAKILQGFKLPGGQTSYKWETNDRTLTINIRAMRPSDSFKGFIFIIQ